jgi:hypothetical protein
MIRIPLAVLIVTLAAHLGASTLSVVPLAEALQNPDLVDTGAEGHTAAVAEVTSKLLNQPATDAERATLHQRLSLLATHRHTRVGRLFFAALKSVPAIEHLPEGTNQVSVTAQWPLALGASIRARVDFLLRDGDWLVSVLEVTPAGVAAAPIAGMAPYFGTGETRPALLDLEAIDYIVGRDASDRSRPESARKPFDYGETLTKLFAAEAGAVETLLDELQAGVNPSHDRETRLKALSKHFDAEELAAMKAADADPEKREAFWSGIFEQLKGAAAAPRPTAMPAATGARVEIGYRVGTEAGTLTVVRRAEDRIAIRGEPIRERDDEEGDGGGD